MARVRGKLSRKPTVFRTVVKGRRVEILEKRDPTVPKLLKESQGPHRNSKGWQNNIYLLIKVEKTTANDEDVTVGLMDLFDRVIFEGSVSRLRILKTDKSAFQNYVIALNRARKLPKGQWERAICSFYPQKRWVGSPLLVIKDVGLLSKRAGLARPNTKH